MMQRYLLIFLLSGMGAGALKAEKVLDGFDEEPFEQPVILPEKTRLSPVAAYMGEPSAGGTGKAVRAVLAASGGGGRKQMAGPEWKGGNGLDCRRIVFPVERLFHYPGEAVVPGCPATRSPSWFKAVVFRLPSRRTGYRSFPWNACTGLRPFTTCGGRWRAGIMKGM